jgi:hypothetical protein
MACSETACRLPKYFLKINVKEVQEECHKYVWPDEGNGWIMLRERKGDREQRRREAGE